MSPRYCDFQIICRFFVFFFQRSSSRFFFLTNTSSKSICIKINIRFMIQKCFWYYKSSACVQIITPNCSLCDLKIAFSNIVMSI